MLDQVKIENVLFLDIETVSEQAQYDDLNSDFKALWQHKSKSVLKKWDEAPTEEEAAAAYEEKAGIFAEFGKIICISVGIVRFDADKKMTVRLKSFASDDEAALLEDFSKLVAKSYQNPHQHFFCGHNIREFDIPYICRRMVVHQLPFPASLNIAGKKPWETKHLLDTLEFWKFGDYKHYTSLKLLAALLGFPSPKDDIDGSEVGRVYWKDKGLERIATYCEKDVLATIQLFLRYKRMPLIEEEQVNFVK